MKLNLNYIQNRYILVSPKEKVFTFVEELSPKEKINILSRIFWDREVNPEELLCLIDKNIDEIKGINELNFFARLLSSCDWYTLLKLLSPEKLKLILDDKIINRLYPKDLKRRFIYAKNVLSK